jgi:hypothetical protein
LRLPRPSPVDVVAAAGLAALTLLLFHRAVFGGQAFYERDVQLVWYPQAEAFVRSIASGSWPVWNPYHSFGHPLLANPDTQALYPFTWLNLILPPRVFYTAFVVAHAAFAGMGVYLLARRLGLSSPSAFMAATCWVGSGPFLSLGNMRNQLAGASWIPWILLAADRALTSPDVTGALLWGSAMAMQLLAGSPDMSVMTAMAVGARTLWSLRPSVHAARPARRVIAVSAVAGAFGLALSAGLWLPALDVARRSARWHLGSGQRTIGSVDPLGLAEVFSPVPLTDLPINAGLRERLYDGAAPLLHSLYLGVPTVALVAAAFIGAASRARWASLALAATAALLSLGHHTVFHEIAVALVPPLRLLRYPSKAMVFAAFGWALLAGLGFERWRRSDTVPRERWPRTVLGPIAVLVAWGFAIALIARWRPSLFGHALLAEQTIRSTWSDALAPAASRLAFTASLGAAVIVAGLARRKRPQAAGGLACLVAVLTVLDLGVAGIGVNPTAPADFYRFRPPILAEVRQDDLSRLYVYRYDLPPAERAGLDTDNPYRVARYPPGFSLDAGRTLAARLYVMPPVGGSWGLFGSYEPDLVGLYPTYLADLTRWMAMAEGTPAYLRFLRMGAVKYVSALHVQGLEDLIPAGVHTSLLARPIRLFQVPEPLPRTYVVGTALAADGDRAREILFDAGFDPSREVILPETSLQAGPRFSGRSVILDFRPDYVRLQAELSEPGVVVLVDTYDPGWKATVDGRPARVLRANVAFRGVMVPAGRHSVEYVYRPWTVVWGLGASAAAALVGLALIFRQAAFALRATR